MLVEMFKVVMMELTANDRLFWRSLRLACGIEMSLLNIWVHEYDMDGIAMHVFFLFFVLFFGMSWAIYQAIYDHTRPPHILLFTEISSYLLLIMNQPIQIHMSSTRLRFSHTYIHNSQWNFVENLPRPKYQNPRLWSGKHRKGLVLESFGKYNTAGS